MAKEYASFSTLQAFLENLKKLFATKTTVDDLSTEVAYIDATDNENIEAEDSTDMKLAEFDERITTLEESMGSYINDIDTLIGGDA